MSHTLPPCDHDECPPTHCARAETEIIKATMLGYMAGIAGNDREPTIGYVNAYYHGHAQGYAHRLGLPIVVPRDPPEDLPEGPPMMTISSELPRTHLQPVHPETGEIWHERAWELCVAATDARYESDAEERAEAKRRYNSLKEGLEFREVPYFCEYTFAMGALAAAAVYGGKEPAPKTKPSKHYGCHPETWALLAPDAQARYQVFDEDQWRRDHPSGF